MRFYAALHDAGDAYMDIHLKVFRSESGVFRNSRQNARTNFFLVMKRKHEVRPAGTLKRLV